MPVQARFRSSCRPLPIAIRGAVLGLLFTAAGPAAAAPTTGPAAEAAAAQTAGDAAYTPAGSAPPAQPEALSAWRQGSTQMAAGQLPAAEESFARAARLDPKSYAPLLGLADVALRRGDPRRADTLLAQARALAPSSAEVAAVSGRVHVVMRRVPEAEAEFRRAIELDPRFPTPRLDLADLLLANGRTDDAVAAFRAAQQAAPRHGGAAFGLGRALLARKDLDGARAAFERSAELEPALPQPRLALAEVLAARQSYAEAKAQIDRAQQLRGGALPARNLRVTVLLAEGRTADAIAEQQALIAGLQGPAAAAALVRLGQIQERLERPGEAAQSYRKAIEVDPGAHVALNNAAWLAAERKLNLDQALADAQKAVQLAPAAASYHDTLGAVLMARGEHAKAVAALTRAAELAPQAAEVRARLAKARELAGPR